MSGPDFGERIRELQRETDALSAQVTKENRWPLKTIAIFAVIPIAVYICILLLKPRFVLNKDQTRNHRTILIVALLFTFNIWIIAYLIACRCH